MATIKVESLHTYPIKSCAGTELKAAQVTSTGLRHDREFMLIDENNNFVSQREMPKLALVDPIIADAAPGITCMDVRAPGMSTLEIVHVPRESRQQDHLTAYVHGNPVRALLMNLETSEWFSDYLDDDVRLVAVDPVGPRYVNERYRVADTSNRLGFADGFPMLLASQASLDQLNKDIAEVTGGEPIPMDRFRPNIVVSGDWLEPYDEDYWRRVYIGQMLASVVRPCKRCSIPYVNQETGKRTDAKTVGKTLSATRRGFDTTKYDDNGKGVFFAQNLAHVYEGPVQLRVGDDVVVYVRDTESNVRQSKGQLKNSRP
jgi:uncharacterized protein YcbX